MIEEDCCPAIVCQNYKNADKRVQEGVEFRLKGSLVRLLNLIGEEFHSHKHVHEDKDTEKHCYCCQVSHCL